MKEVRENGGMQTELMDQTNLPVILLGFDGSPVYDDTAVLNRWLDVTEKIKTAVVPRSTTRFHCMTATIIRGQQNSGLQSAGAEIL